jgi:formylglycine-generating enzyme required for sulfatase activity
MHTLAGIVGFMHSLDPPIVHRDLKPANVLLQPTARGTVALRVADFGIGSVAARQALAPGAASLTRALRGAHTPLYASPQQVRGEPPDVRDDVHALGVVWYQLLAGDLHLLSLPPDWREGLVERGVPATTLNLLGACLSSRPERRPRDGAALAEELAHLGPAHEPPPGNGSADLAGQVQRALRHSEQMHARARRAAEEGHDYAGAVALLEEVPLPLRDPALYVALAERRDRAESLERQVRQGVEAGRFARLRPQVEELLQLLPHRDDLRRLLETLPRHTPLERPGSPPRAPTEHLRNSIGMLLQRVGPGTFRLGSLGSEMDREVDEWPAREVEITQPFYLGVYPVTQKQYEKVMGWNPSHFHSGRGGGPDHPVEHVSWEDASTFCEQLSALPEERRAGRIYRLPSEAEWEYACRAGTTTPFHFGRAATGALANFDGRRPYGTSEAGPYLQRTSPVGLYPGNDFGLFDMHGNVWEWCADWYASTYARGQDQDPQGAPAGTERVRRGGSWADPAGRCRSAARGHGPATQRCGWVGFRVALNVASWAAE